MISSPVIKMYSAFTAGNWFGQYELCPHGSDSTMTTQFIDTVITGLINWAYYGNLGGYAQQLVFLNGSGNYNITFEYLVKSPYDTNLLNLDINWNGAIVQSVKPTILNHKYQVNVSVVG